MKFICIKYFGIYSLSDYVKYNDYLKFWMDVLVHPGKATKRALTIKDALKLYYTLAIIPVVLGVVMVFVFGGVRSFSSSTSMFAAFPSLMGLLSTYGLEIGIGYLLFAILVMTPINAFINSGVMTRMANNRYPMPISNPYVLSNPIRDGNAANMLVDELNDLTPPNTNTMTTPSTTGIS